MKQLFSVFFVLLFGITMNVAVFTLENQAQETGSQEQAATATPADATPAQAAPSPTEVPINPEEDIERIKEKQQTLVSELEQARSRLEITDATPPEAITTEFRKQVDVLQNIQSIYNQRITALEQYKTLKTQIEQYNDQLKKFQEEKPEQSPSFLELERLRSELNAETARKDSVQAKVEIAKTALDQAKNTLNERQTQQSILQDKINNTQEEAQKRILEAQLQTLRLQTRLAQETLRLRQIEHRDAQLAQEAYQANIKFLDTRYQFFQQNAKFTQNDLNQINQQLKEEELSLNRALEELNKNKEILTTRLSAARTKMAQQTDDPAALEEYNARQLEFDENQTRIKAINVKQELLLKRRAVWDRRYQIYNNLAGNEEYEVWKQEARAVIDDLEVRLRLLANDLSTNQNALSQLNSKIGSVQEPNASTLKWLNIQKNALQQISQVLLDRQNELQKTRRLHERLVEEINQRIATLSLEERLQQILQLEWMGNPVSTWSTVGIIFLAVFLALLFIRWLIRSRLRKLASRKDAVVASFLLEGAMRIRNFFLFAVALLFASRYLAMSVEYRDGLTKILYAVLILQVGILASYILRSWIFHHLARKAKRDQTSMGALSIFNFIVQFVVWSVVLLSALSAMGFNVTTLIAGLGVGGVAVALALQKILGDLFASLSIVLDKPFVIGDFVIFDNYTTLGTIESIGLKTTRLRSLSGEQIICSNSYMLETQIRNFKRMHERRVLFKLGVIYQTPYEKLQRIPQILREIVQSQARTRFDRSHFQAYGDFSLNFEVVYYVLSPDYNVYMDIQQNINLEIYRRFNEEGIEFAYPTSMTYINQDSPFKVTSSFEEPSQG